MSTAIETEKQVNAAPQSSRLSVWPAIASLAIIGLILCFVWGKRRPVQPAMMAEACPHSWDGVDGFPDNGELDIAPQTTTVPEFHDCQRFIVYDSGEPRFDSVFAIFARQVITNITLKTPLDPTGVPLPTGMGTNVADFNKAPSGGTTSQKLDTSVVIKDVFGEIYATGPYDTLGIKTDFNCLVLGRNGSGSYSAEMYSLGKESGACASYPALATYLSAHPTVPKALKVRVTKITPMTEVPGVARWDWDNANKLQYIGIWCPDGWCEVYNSTSPGFSSDNAGSLGGGSFASNIRLTRGWYDEQVLAHYTADHHLKADGQRFAIYPDPSLITRTHPEDYVRGRWYPSAYLGMVNADADYTNKLGVYSTASLAPTLPGGTNNTLSLCTDVVPLIMAGPAMKTNAKNSTIGAIPVPSTNTPKTAILPNPDPCGVRSLAHPLTCTSHWFAKIEFPGKRTSYFCATYRENAGHITANGVVRWRWKDNDDTVWISCPFGCCEVEADTRAD